MGACGDALDLQSPGHLSGLAGAPRNRTDPRAASRAAPARSRRRRAGPRWIQRIISAVHSAIRGGMIFGAYLVRRLYRGAVSKA